MVLSLHLVRHAESEKNLANIPGGRGAGLTVRGRMQAAQIAERIKSFGTVDWLLLTAPSLQTFETAEIIGAVTGLSPIVEPLLRGIDLGELAGLPIEHAEFRFPASAASMQLWRDGNIEISDLKIPGLESPWAFYRRGLEAYFRMPRKGDVMLFCNTSVMILFVHIFNRVTPRSGDGYKVIQFDNIEIYTISEPTHFRSWARKVLRKLGGDLPQQFASGRELP